MKKSIAILGAGNAGTAFALLLAHHRVPIHVYCVEPDVEQDINQRHRNEKYLTGIKLPTHITAHGNIADALLGAELVVIAVPSSVLEEVMILAHPFLTKNMVLASLTKGIDATCLEPVSVALQRLLPKALRNKLCLIGGPAVANELAQNHPSALLIAGPSRSAREYVASMLRTKTVKTKTSDDLIGVGYAMALKNPYAIALGMSDGLKFPMNTKALILCLALNEMQQLILAVGGRPETTTSLAGVGDLLVTGFSHNGRNRTYGERLVGASTKDPKKLGLTTVEGIVATERTLALARKLKVTCPLLETVAKCLSAKHHFEQSFIQYLSSL